MVGNKSRSCEEPLLAKSFNYFSASRDANAEGQGNFYDQSFIDDSIGGWKAPGGTLQSHWRMETPYFCGHFNNSSRVYIEKMGGNSLDSYSWIYVDTDPFIQIGRAHV